MKYNEKTIYYSVGIAARSIPTIAKTIPNTYSKTCPPTLVFITIPCTVKKLPARITTHSHVRTLAPKNDLFMNLISTLSPVYLKPENLFKEPVTSDITKIRTTLI